MVSSTSVNRQGISLLLGQLALERGLISSAQLRSALEEQSLEGSRIGLQARRLGEILISRRHLTDSCLEGLLRDQKAALSRPAPAAREDSFLGILLVRIGAVPPRHVDRCLRLQAEAAERKEGAVPRLGEILVQQGFASAEVIAQALAMQKKTILACDSCAARCNVEAFDPSRTYPCATCPGHLEPVLAFEKVQVDDSTVIISLEEESSGGSREGAGKEPRLQLLGKYTIVRKVGKGGMGVVYEALDRDLDRKVALKLLMTRGMNPEEIAVDEQRFLREARLCARLPKHPHIVSVYDAGAIDGTRYMAMEYIEGKSLAEGCRSGAIPLHDQMVLLRDVALGVHHAHEHGVIHRDLKPQNILLDGTGRPHITDFGLARSADRGGGATLTADGMVLGTPGYMSPEQARGLKSVDRRTDVYSLGVMLYEMISGRVPFLGRTAVEVLAKIIQDPVPRPSAFRPGHAAPPCDPVLEAIALKALQKDPADRYPTAIALADDLSLWLAGWPVEAPLPAPAPDPAPTSPPLQLPPRRRLRRRKRFGGRRG